MKRISDPLLSASILVWKAILQAGQEASLDIFQVAADAARWIGGGGDGGT